MKRSAELFEKAVELRGDARAVFLDRACGEDTALRAEVESLLEAHDAAGAYLSEPTGSLDEARRSSDDTETSSTRDHAPPPHRVIGRYKLLEQIGEGGFGTVWMAEQREPVRRRVAVKIIKPGMDSGQVIARFEAERQALAMMEHPNIARVLDGGTTDTGGPYFVMEYITGVPILEYCDTERLDTRARLELFTQACNAIQHAHQKGIIHRDIKPSNVMVTLHDGVPVVKVIDFGIAKATNAELTNRTLFTAHHQMLGTPAYMSPEQAEMSGLDIDTRSDIYSLGVLLYELLTGTTPFATEELLREGFAEMMRIIREDEPQKPSTRLSSLGATATRTAAQRHADVRKLGLLLRGDLDWIVMKCLEKDRSRRYETANGLAADVRRHLTDEPVTAGPPSASYRFRKFIKRHRAGVVAATIVAVALGLGAAGTIAGMLRAQSAEATARALQPQADEYAARVLVDEVDELWPPSPDDPAMIPDLEEWVVTARDALPGFLTSREQVRKWLAHGASMDEADQSGLRDLLARMEVHLELLDDGDGLLAADAVIPGYGWSVPKRLAFAQRLATGFEDEDHAAAWADARRRIPLAEADLDDDGNVEPAYTGLDLKPQTGLLPLGPDPDSGLWEFAHLLTGEPAERDENGKLVLTEETGLVLVLIPGGTFFMGRDQNPSPEDREREWSPRTKGLVTLSPYFLSKSEMTQGQWKRLTGVNPSSFGPDAEWKPEWLASGEPPSLLHPVEFVSWEQCDKWLRRAGLSLPSESQWERAARAGTRTLYSTGRNAASLSGAANVRDEHFERAVTSERWKSRSDGSGAGRTKWEKFNDGSAVHWAVGDHLANNFGLHDVHGNVQEWCLDDFAPYRVSYSNPDVDPVVVASSDPNSGSLGGTKVIRGGSWRFLAVEARSGNRYHFPPDVTAPAMGVRPARAIANR